MTSTIGLADAIEDLRRELTDATRRGDGQSIRFTIDAIELELELEVVREGGGDGKVSFKVLGSGIDVGAKGNLAHTNVHRIKLCLKPTGETGPLEVRNADPIEPK